MLILLMEIESFFITFGMQNIQEGFSCLKVSHQNSAQIVRFLSKSLQLFLNGKIYIIFDHNALLSI